MATKMFDGKIQIELDFFKIPNVMYQIGHVGIPDFSIGIGLSSLFAAMARTKLTHFDV